MFQLPLEVQAKVAAYMKFGGTDTECSNENPAKGKYQILPTNEDGSFPITLGKSTRLPMNFLHISPFSTRSQQERRNQSFTPRRSEISRKRVEIKDCQAL
jgi:hypothetical protein